MYRGILVPMYPPILAACSAALTTTWFSSNPWPCRFSLMLKVHFPHPLLPTHPRTQPSPTLRGSSAHQSSQIRAEVSPPKILTTSNNKDHRAHTVSTTTMLAWNISLLFFLSIHSLTVTPHFVFPSYLQSTCTVLSDAFLPIPGRLLLPPSLTAPSQLQILDRSHSHWGFPLPLYLGSVYSVETSPPCKPQFVINRVLPTSHANPTDHPSFQPASLNFV